MLQRCAEVLVICMVSPVTRCSTTVASNETTSVFFNAARATQARESRKSPASTATLFPITKFNEPIPRLVSASSNTSSWRRLATWIISVISAIHCCFERNSVGKVSCTLTAGSGRCTFKAVAISNKTVGRNLFPSTPILKKYSAAEASLGTSATTMDRNLLAKSDSSSATSENGSSCSSTKELLW
uniref:Geranylgeranyl pyrophosphate synthase n=1 Tax=Rhizophora mucronata TaxID=61149 RepID=A0A2P2LC13_RHIMU